MATSTTYLTAWQRVWRVGIAPQLSVAGLNGLRKALQQDSPQLITGATTSPPPLQCMADWPVEACCPLCFVLLDGRKPSEITVGELEERFATVCYRADQLVGEAGAIRYFLNPVDEWSRPELIRNLLPEIEWALAQQTPEQPAEPQSPLARLLAESIRVVQHAG